MNQSSKVPFGSNASYLAGYAYRANARLGNIDLIFDNQGANDATIILKEATAPSGWTPITTWFTVVAGGNVTKSLKLLSKKVGFFGSGNTTVNVSSAIRNPADLRGAEYDIVITGRKDWGFDPAFDTPAFEPNWGDPSDLIGG
jgi:hypothetical protein